MAELQKIIEDPVYFAEKYFYIINGDVGKTLIKVYPKQAEMIRGMCSYQRFICLSARQTGKCITGDTVVHVRKKDEPDTATYVPIQDVFSMSKKFNEKFESDDPKKFIESYKVNDLEVETDTGWKDAIAIHLTKLFTAWKVKTDKHEMICADKHLVYREFGGLKETQVKKLKKGDMIITDLGSEAVEYVEKLPFSENMYDLSVDSDEHRYFTNGILSHNSTSYTIFALWYSIINKEKTILICANKFNTAKDILSRIKLAYEELPNWLKPGVVEWNKGAVTFDNGCKIMAEATSGSSGRRIHGKLFGRGY